MQKVPFDEAVAQLTEIPGGFCAEAYHLVNSSLTHTLISLGVTAASSPTHVNGRQLCLGFREFMLKEYGPMAPTLLGLWGIHETRQIGEMVFNLINIGCYSKTDKDCVEDFVDIFDFHDSFVLPFEPKPSDRNK
jgi:uncharacterized repeat protein (TIGR04138 family)